MSQITIGEDLDFSLHRLFELRVLTDEEEATDEHFAEFRNHQSFAIPILMPLIARMIDAGIITINVELGDTDVSEHTAITGEPDQLFENGSIWISGKYSGGSLKQ